MNDAETIEVRAEERLDLERLEPYLRAHLPQAPGPLSVRQFGGGHANLTYLIGFGEREYVLRRPPLGPVPAHAHDMRREHAVLSKLYVAFPLAPQSYHLCTDAAILGADFVVEERKRGRAIRRDRPADYAGDPGLCKRLGEALIDTLADLHGVDADAIGLGDLGRPEGYLQRQLDGWRERWTLARTPSSADGSAMLDALARDLPTSPTARIVHNDYKLGNLLLDPSDPARVSAVLDWDMCTLGDPLMDLGYALALWAEGHDPEELRAGSMPTWHPGFPSRREAIQRYAARTGIDVSRAAWYHTFNVFRFAVILQQIYKRYELGQTHDARFAGFGAFANALIAKAETLAGK